MDISQRDFVRILQDLSHLIEREQDLLNALDRATGDGDHGFTMASGWKAAIAALEGLPEEPGFPAICNTAAKAFMNSVGGSAGPLYATILMRGGATVKGQERLCREDVLRFFEAACQGIRDRGKAEPGDKTMLDAWLPAIAALREAVAEGRPTPACLQAAHVAAKAGAEATAAMVAKLGRASRLGERTLGHVDPGAASSALFFRAFAESAATGAAAAAS